MSFSPTQLETWYREGSDDFRALRPAGSKVKVKLPDRLAKGMNKQEAKYADHLSRLKIAKVIHAYEWTGTNRARAFKVGKRRRYTPDFYVWVTPDRMEIHEVKGYLRDGGSIRFDLAAEANPGIVFRMVRWTRWGWEEIRVRNEHKPTGE